MPKQAEIARQSKGEAASASPVFMFPGQGSQKLGMGASFMGRPLVVDTFTCASDIYGFDVAKLASDGPEEVLNQTKFAQAAILTLSLALLCSLQEEGIEASAVLGFSLGQIAALAASGILGIEDTFKLAKVRAEAMERATLAHSGAMCAILGAHEEEARQLCATAAEDDVLVLANYNCPGQLVISGELQAIKRAQEAWTGLGKKAVILATSGAFHSPLMQDAAEELFAYCERLNFASPKTLLVCNTDASAFKKEEAAARLSRQLCRPVLFQQSVEGLMSSGTKSFIEVGHGATLAGFVKRINKESKRHIIDTAEKLDALLLLQGEA